MIRRSLLSAILILLSALGATAQTNNQYSRPEPKTRDRVPLEDEQKEVTIPAEMRVKMEIARAEGEHKKLLEDVQKLGDLSAEVAKSYAERKQISAEDVKKLSTIEKLAKRVLSHAGGDEVSDKSATGDPPLAEAIDLLNIAAEEIRKDVKAETRFVVSATVIANSNEVINLARLIRRTKKTD
jgi:hypothetical protein